jgi:hypothetical protein
MAQAAIQMEPLARNDERGWGRSDREFGAHLRSTHGVGHLVAVADASITLFSR